METPKTYSDKLTITIPLKETCGETMETAIEISGVHFNQVIYRNQHYSLFNG